MKKILFTIFISFFLGPTAFAQNNKQAFFDQVKRLISKEYTFFAIKAPNIYKINGIRRYYKISFEELYRSVNFSKYPVGVESTQIAKDILYYHKDGFDIVLRKKKKFYKLVENKFVRYKPVEDARKLDAVIERKRTIEKTHCPYCTFKLSGNYITIDDDAQYNGEIAWLPYYRISATTGIRFSLGGSPYYIENDDLEKVYSVGLKVQALYRVYVYNLYFELGGGTHYFLDYKDFSSVATTGIGYTFSDRWWFWKETINFSGIFFHLSTVNWERRINEAKLGIGFNF